MPHNFIGIERKINNFRKGTLIDPLDEPTYLTFALDFNFERSSGENMSAVDESRLWDSPLLQTDSDLKNTASKFLSNRGYSTEAEALNAFIGLLRYLTEYTPWYFQSVKGLPKMFSQSEDMSKAVRSDKLSVTVDTLEAVDLRMSELAGLYRKAIYDMRNRRERVPDNLRWFSMDIYLAEFRDLRYNFPPIIDAPLGALGINTTAISSLIGEATAAVSNVSALSSAFGGPSFDIGEQYTGVLANFGYIKFRCRQCEFDFSDGFPGKSTVNIGGREMNAETNSFKIKIGHFEEEARYGTGTVLHDDFTKKSKIKNPWKTKNVGNAIESAFNYADRLTGNQLSDRLSQTTFGSGTARENSVASKINGMLQSVNNFAGQNSPKDLGKVYPENEGSAPTSGGNDLGDAYPDLPPNPPVNDLGDAYPDLPPNPPVDDLGDVYP